MPTTESRDEIDWPSEFQTDKVKVHVRNEIQINATPEQVWAHLIRALRWPGYYSNAHDVRLIDEPGPDLGPNTRFHWKTFGLNLVSEVLEFVPGKRLAWNGSGLGTWVCHAWLLRPVDDGCWVLTEENQNGWLCRLHKLFRPQHMHEEHQNWLEGLKREAEAGPPPPWPSVS
ncbi:MAG TPA: SRPBCC domain-containing protein [Thermoanaerobaculia bacterium]|nr:SRPBCC domain-containing protein [Thermoanaerobaculia bacterium]